MSQLLVQSFLILILATTLPVWPQGTAHVAKAYGLSDGSLLYSEHHEKQWEDGRIQKCRISYRSPNGEEFASKTLDFRHDPAAPAFSFHDKRFDYREGAIRVGDGLVLYGGVGESEKRPVTLPPEPVVDAGFHRYVDRHFKALTSGEIRDVKFAVPAHGKFLGFRIAKVDDLEYRGEPAHRFRLRAANLFLRLLADPVHLIYDEEGRLREFVGISNIKDDLGKPHNARIVFEYDTVRAESVSGTGVRAAANTP